MTADVGSEDVSGDAVVPTLMVPEIRDYQEINKQLTFLLSAGHPYIRLAGVDAQRLLLWGLRGLWKAVVEVDGLAGPELAASLDAPDLIVVCRGGVLDGVGSGLLAGTVIVNGSAGAAAGYSQRGGLIVVQGEAGPRAGLNQSGGVLILEGPVGRLAGERQLGGHLFAQARHLGAHPGHARRGGRFVVNGSTVAIDPLDRAVYENAIACSSKFT